MNRAILTDEQWQTIWTFPVAPPRVSVGATDSCRRFLNAVRWVRRSGAQGRLLPVELERWNSVFKRFSRWGVHGVWTDWHRHIADDPDLQEVFLDSTIIRAHACAAGQQKAPRWRKPWDAPAVASVPSSTR